MIAWFLYTLMNDKEAENVFVGKNAEIYWKDVKIKSLKR